MTLTNTPLTYGSVTKSFHWLTALLILTAIPLGAIADGLPYDTSEELARKALVFSIHKTVGIAAFAVALARILWAISQPKPGLLNADKPAEAWAAETVHWLLYGSLVVVPLTGWIHHAATQGFAPIWWPFGQDLPFVPKDEGVAALFAGLHVVTKWVLVAAIGLHVAGALKHHFVDRDATLRRMLPGRDDAPTPPPGGHVLGPLVTALVLWAGAVGAGTYLGAYRAETLTRPSAPLDAVASDWRVVEGRLGIAVTQLGSRVEGGFADWTAAIGFEPRDTPGPSGSADVTIAIGSLTLGSITAQALGADFFDAATFPTATFTAQILTTQTGHVAEGQLTIRDQSIPVSLAFDLTIEGDTAKMSGRTTVNRMDFGIGATAQPTEQNVGFAVEISVALTARRAFD
jgi:cytochrome b561/polyisoprenoid-binding protein YceI